MNWRDVVSDAQHNPTPYKYEGSYAPKCYFKFCSEDPVYFIHLMEQKLKQKFGFIKRVDKGEITTVKDSTKQHRCVQTSHPSFQSS